MSHDVSPAERYTPPEAGVFNVDAMEDEQILVLCRALDAAGAQGVPEGLSREGMAVELLEQLDADLRDLAARDPERVKNLMARCVKSPYESDREVAAGVLPALLDYDYEFTRDSLIFLRVDDGEDRPSEERKGRSNDGAAGTIHELRQTRLTPAQIADFDARLAAHRR